MSRFKSYEVVGLVFWVLALATIPLWSASQGIRSGWDLQVYKNAIHALRLGHDPYADGIAVQEAYHRAPRRMENQLPPYTYVYSPLTLPLLRVIARHPAIFRAGFYWVLYAAGTLLVVWVGIQAAEENERRFVALAAPAAIYFPGLLQSTVALSGNVASILYGLVFAAALLGWRRNRWLPFYLAVFVSACCKAPMLTLLAIPVLSARRQWLPAGFTFVAALACFSLQPYLWPSAFQQYLTAVALQFSYNHDFGVSPAGILGDTLFQFNLPYTFASSALYAVYAAAVAIVLLRLSKRFLAGEFSLRQWMPLALLGSVLLNPRIKEYDVAALTMPMAILAWRLCGTGAAVREQAWKLCALFLGVNWIVSSAVDVMWKPAECVLIVSLFAAGSWQLWRRKPSLAAIGRVPHSSRVYRDERVEAAGVRLE